MVTDVDAALEFRRRLLEASDRVERLRIIHDSPIFSFWFEVKAELAKAADEIEALRSRVRALEGEDA
jgi:hypothetical protein